jgi:hypothetical protein
MGKVNGGEISKPQNLEIADEYFWKPNSLIFSINRFLPSGRLFVNYFLREISNKNNFAYTLDLGLLLSAWFYQSRLTIPPPSI